MNRYIKGLHGKEFFMAFYYYGFFGCGKIAIENPIPSKVYELPKPTQAIQPYEYGHPYTKKTYLWTFGLPELKPTNIVEPLGGYVCGNAEIWKRQAAQGKVYGKEKSAKHRSKTFQGIAEAMAEQWGGLDEPVLQVLQQPCDRERNLLRREGQNALRSINQANQQMSIF